MTTAEVARKRWADKASEPEEMARVRAHERERCADIANLIAEHVSGKWDSETAYEIEKRIRSGK